MLILACFIDIVKPVMSMPRLACTTALGVPPGVHRKEMILYFEVSCLMCDTAILRLMYQPAHAWLSGP